jgi:hypothetical protein
MQVALKKIIYDVSSTEQIPLIMNGINVGSYSFGTFSKWSIMRMNKMMREIPDISIYISWLINEHFNIELKDPNFVDKALERCDGDIGRWFEQIMENEL